MASFLTNTGADGLTTGGGITWASDTIKARLMLSGSTIDRDDTAMTAWTKVSGTTDQTLGSKTKTKDTTNDRIVFDSADPSWTAVASGTVIGVGIFKFVTDDAGSTPIAFLDAADITANGSDISFPISASGLFYLQE